MNLFSYNIYQNSASIWAGYLESSYEIMEILENFNLNLDVEEIKKRVHVENADEMDEIQSLVDAAQPLIKAKAAYKVWYIEEKLEDGIVLDGIRLTSRVLRKNLDEVQRVFLYVLTIGDDLEKEVRAYEDLLEQFRLDTVGTVALNDVRKHLEDHLCARFGLEQMSYMSPGSLDDWPITEQRHVFSILGDVEAAIGVRLNDTLLMIPRKSLSGVYFPTEVPFFSCQLCRRKGCPSRKAAFDENLARGYGTSISID